MNAVKKERWSEREVLALPAGEHDYFDRKSGVLLNSQDFRKDVAKALSAFANSGGGHLVLGITDAGVFDGVPPMRGNTPTREWLEQVIPNLLSYPLEDFRVHEVEPDSPSAIPAGMVVIVIDVGDSALAPHQTESTRTYFYREGGHSKPAPHFYLETLRNRLSSPRLAATLVDFDRTHLCDSDGLAFIAVDLRFRIENVGRIAAYKWAVIVEGSSGDAEGRGNDYRFRTADFPACARSVSGGVSLDDTILPSLGRIEKHPFGIQLRGPVSDRPALLADLGRVMSPSLQIHYRVVTETSRGERQSTYLASLAGFDRLLQSLMV